MMGESHFFLVAFYQVPLAILVSLWTPVTIRPCLRPGASAWRPTFALRRAAASPRSRSRCCVRHRRLLRVLRGRADPVAGASTAVERRSSRHALAGRRAHGGDRRGADRAERPDAALPPRDGDQSGHRERSPSKRRRMRSRSRPCCCRCGTPDPGALGGLVPLRPRVQDHRGGCVDQPRRRGRGRLSDLDSVLVRRRRALGDRAALLSTLARFNLVALLLATTGGFGALFALLVSPQIRTYARCTFTSRSRVLLRRAAARSALATRRRTGVLLTARSRSSGCPTR